MAICNRFCVYILLTFFYFVTYQLYAQPAELEDIQAIYKNERGVFLYRDKHIKLNIENDTIRGTAEVKKNIIFLKNGLGDAIDISVYGGHFCEIQNLEAYSKIWEKSKYRKLPLSGLTKQKDDDATTFFDDSYQYNLTFPAADRGNQAVWSYTEVYKDARFITPYYFQDFLPQHTSKYSIEFPNSIEVKWKVLNDTQNRVKFKETKKGKVNFLEWTIEKMPELKGEPGDAGVSYYVPVVVLYVTGFQQGNTNRTVLSSVNDLHKWYREHLYKTQESTSSDFAKVAATITAGANSDLEKVKRVFYWVQDQIRYIAFEDGMRGFVPHHPEYTLEKKYGDCKDMASLIVGLLKELNIKSYHTWIGTRHLAYRYSETPTPIVDNHMIATYIDKDSSIYYLDATSNYTKFGLPSSMIQGKEALISIDDSSYLIKIVPVIEANESLQIDTVKLTFLESTLIGSGKSTFTGFQKVFASYDFNKTLKSKEKEYVTAWLKKGNNKFILNNYEIKNINDKDNPLEVKYNFQIPTYINIVGDELYLNLNLVKAYNNYSLELNRNSPFEVDYTFSFNNTYILEIPNNFTIEYLPESKVISDKLVEYKVTYRVKEDKIEVNQFFSKNTLMLPKEEVAQWNNVIQKLSNDYKETIILKRKS